MESAKLSFVSEKRRVMASASISSLSVFDVCGSESDLDEAQELF
jgi:hypothetical protein